MAVTAPAIPKDAAELEAMLGDTSTLAEIAKTPAALGEFVRNYVKSQQAKNGEYIEATVKEQAQIAVAEMLKDNASTLRNRGKLDLGKGSPSKGAAYLEDAPGALLDGEFRNFNEFMASIRPDGGRARRGAEDQERWRRIANDYSTVDPAKGGFLVPEVFRSQLLQASLETAIVRPRAMVVEMDGPVVAFPTVDETTHVDSLYGGITGTWVGEGESLPESEARFGRVVLRANKLVSYCEAPSELPADAPRAWSSFINTAMPRAISFFEDDAFLTGNGVGKPLGVLHANNTALVTVAKESGQTADTIHWENLIKMYARMLPGSLGTAVWIASIDTFPELATMALSVGTGGSAIWLNNGVEGPPARILGRPVLFSEKVNKLGDGGDISFVDLGQYLVGDRGEMRVQSSEHYKFGNDVVSYRVIQRADGRPWLKSAITPANGSTNTLSPYVTLAERA